ncbi:nitroreductase family protein [Amycolatopsis sp. NPDC001319]|uniref:nitroreductase family protein n=1 Tax=unclassified Amycolatopsis TaxID=2618356 RepID=UPI0036C5FF6C
MLELSPDQLLSTTRAVRKRLDFTRDVPDDLIRECVALALQAPAGSNVVTARFVVVRDEAKRRAIGEIYGSVYAQYKASPHYPGNNPGATERDRAQSRLANSADYLGERMGEAPVLVLACNEGPDRASATAGMSNILPATWSFMLAARARGLGTAWTSMHVAREKDVANLLGIPYETVAQAVLTPLAFTKGTDFRPAPRPAPDEVTHWDQW